MKITRKLLAILLSLVILASTATVFAVQAQHGRNEPNGSNNDKDDHEGNAAFEARLNGFQQVPAIISNGTGSFTAVLNPDGVSINYTLSYSELGSTAHVAHIHVGQAGVNGAVIVFLCGGGGKPDCPASGSVSGRLTSSDVKAIADQGVTARNFNQLLLALRHDIAYVNVHTTNFPNGEIRGQIHFNEEDND